MAEGTFATAINCIDGRAQQPVTDWLRSRYGTDYVDMVTVPGPDAALVRLDASGLHALRDAVAISVNAHHSRVIAVAGHFDCAANPVTDTEHRDAIRQAAEVAASWGLPAEVLGLWVNSSWQVELVTQRGAGSAGQAS